MIKHNSSLTMLSQKTEKSEKGRIHSAKTRNRMLLKKGMFQEGLSRTNNSDLESIKSEKSIKRGFQHKISV